jgi:hypothetical protein
MKRRLYLSCFILICLLTLSFASLSRCQSSEATVNVTFYFSYGGLLWVNGTSVVNATTVTYENNTLLVLAATPTNANYSYSNMILNGTLVTNNPVSFVLINPGLDILGWNVSSDWFAISNQTVTANFVEESVPSPTPIPDVTADDAVALAVVAILFAVTLPIAFIIVFSNKKTKE